MLALYVTLDVEVKSPLRSAEHQRPPLHPSHCGRSTTGWNLRNNRTETPEVFQETSDASTRRHQNGRGLSKKRTKRICNLSHIYQFFYSAFLRLCLIFVNIILNVRNNPSHNTLDILFRKHSSYCSLLHDDGFSHLPQIAQYSAASLRTLQGKHAKSTHSYDVHETIAQRHRLCNSTHIPMLTSNTQFLLIHPSGIHPSRATQNAPKYAAQCFGSPNNTAPMMRNGPKQDPFPKTTAHPLHH